MERGQDGVHLLDVGAGVAGVWKIRCCNSHLGGENVDVDVGDALVYAREAPDVTKVPSVDQERNAS